MASCPGRRWRPLWAVRCLIWSVSGPADLLSRDRNASRLRFRGMQVQRDAMDKVNFKKELAQLYNPTNTDWQLVRVPTMNFLMVDGKGDPNTAQDYSDAVEALIARP